MSDITPVRGCVELRYFTNTAYRMDMKYFQMSKLRCRALPQVKTARWR